MKSPSPGSIASPLMEVAASGDEPLASLAEALARIGKDEIDNKEEAPLAEAKERIALFVARLAEKGFGPTSVIEALITLDEILLKQGVIKGPFATRMAALAAECALHAARERYREQTSLKLAEQSPIYTSSGSTLYAIPVGPMDHAGCGRFIERLLSEVLGKRPKRVVMVLTGLEPLDNAIHRVFSDIIDDLRAQKIRVKVIS